MRFSGIILVFLVIGHMAIMLTWDTGAPHQRRVRQQRWSSPGWQIWGPDHAVARTAARRQRRAHSHRRLLRKDSTRFWLNLLLAVSMILTLVLGTYALLTFNTGS